MGVQKKRYNQPPQPPIAIQKGMDCLKFCMGNRKLHQPIWCICMNILLPRIHASGEFIGRAGYEACSINRAPMRSNPIRDFSILTGRLVPSSNAVHQNNMRLLYEALRKRKTLGHQIFGFTQSAAIIEYFSNICLLGRTFVAFVFGSFEFQDLPKRRLGALNPTRKYCLLSREWRQEHSGIGYAR